MKLKELHLHNNKLGYEGVEKLSQELAVSVLPGRKDAEGPPPRARPQAS